MGTRLDAVFINVQSEKADILASQINKELDKLEKILSFYRPDSELSILNRNAYIKDFKVSTYLLETINLCIDYYKLTNGVFDAGRAKLTGIKYLDRREASVDTSSVLNSSGIELVEIKPDNTIRYHGKDVQLDPGGFGKGLAMRRVKELLMAEGIDNALVSFGESSILALGAHPHGDHWPIAVTDIFTRQTVARLARLSNRSISTSGTGFVDESGIFRPSQNIIDPRTGNPLVTPLTVSVISDDPFEAEVLSTSLLIDNNCLSPEFEKSGKEAFAVIYDIRKNFVVKEIF